MALSDVENGTELHLMPGSAKDLDQADGRGCRNYRTLAILSVVFGCSCVGYKALENSFKAEFTQKPKDAEKYSQKAKKYSILSCVTLLCVIIAIPSLLILVSYLLTLAD